MQVLWRAMGEHLLDVSNLITAKQSQESTLVVNKKPAEASPFSFDIIVSDLTTEEPKLSGTYRASSSDIAHSWRGSFASRKSTSLEQVLAPPTAISEDVSNFLALTPIVETQLTDGGVGAEDKAQKWANNIFEEVRATLQMQSASYEDQATLLDDDKLTVPKRTQVILLEAACRAWL